MDELDLPGDPQRHVQLLLGPGIPVGFISNRRKLLPPRKPDPAKPLS